jgi:two-component system OmpR family response regulator
MQALVVHDSFLTRTILSGILREQDFEVSTAKTGEAALGLLADGLKPDLVVVHLLLPHPAPLSLLAEIRRRCSAKLVVLLSEADAALEARALAGGADACLHRPLTYASVQASLRGLGLRAGQGLQAALAC